MVIVMILTPMLALLLMAASSIHGYFGIYSRP